MDLHQIRMNPFSLLASSVEELLLFSQETSMREPSLKTALILALCKFLPDKCSLAAVSIIYGKHRLGVEEIVNHILQGWEAVTGKKRL
ncbi:uncharacterized protein LOC123219080 isoform X1 [Mangifera indica]|uniref:uncharacterized protein LOC123219080 isoform X1 n=1 Tax=Mangifera indica TaxID=29780 RepID=UPI001CFBA44C|nr:uncharacterized protein LOC123219080 isoform X1 [Mangifera indica]